MARYLKDTYISPFTDFGFKKLFGTELNKDLLIDFLNQLLQKDEGVIVDLTYLNNELLPRHQDERKAIFDIYCENEKGEKFIVELQKAKQNYFKDRSIYYSSFPIQHQAQKGPWNFKLKAIYTIGILDFVFDEDKDDDQIFHHEVKLVDTKTKKVFYDKLTYVYLEMPKFNKTEDQLETQFDKWMYVLKNLNDLTKRPAKLQERVFEKLFKQAEIAQYTEQEYDEYELSLKYYRDLKNSIDTAYGDGYFEGVEKGIEKGLQKGKEETTIAIVKNLKKAGASNDMIYQATGLSVTEINKITQ